MSATPTRQLVVVERVGDLRRELAQLRSMGARVGFVPTMGALHDGHRRLIETAGEHCDVVVVSCYVNPAQFGPGEDLDQYPRSAHHDEQVAAAAGADLLWRPADRDVYGAAGRESVMVRVGRIGDVLEGASRPGHFDGVASVVVRLLNVVRPNELVLGRKDYQQVVVLQRVIDDLLLDVHVRVVATVRDTDGLAMSSRNTYLDADERQAARAIPRSLTAAQAAFRSGERSSESLLAAARYVFDSDPMLQLDYLELLQGTNTLERVEQDAAHQDVLLVAARIGTTRLIDNVILGEDDGLEAVR